MQIELMFCGNNIEPEHEQDQHETNLHHGLQVRKHSRNYLVIATEELSQFGDHKV